MFESKSERFPDDPAAHLGPGSHDYKYPDEVTMEKKMVRRDPSFLGGVSHQGINNGEIKNEPSIERSVRHGDPGERGPGHYGIPEYIPRNPDDLTNQPVPADNPCRPSSSMLSSDTFAVVVVAPPPPASASLLKVALCKARSRSCAWTFACKGAHERAHERTRARVKDGVERER